MDNLTHTLFGAALAEAGLKRRTPLATPVLLIGANLPDVDIVAAFFGHSLSFRRGWTHGVLAIAVLPLLLTLGTLLWHRFRTRRSPDPEQAGPVPREVLLLSFVAVLSHPFLDWLNNYGLRWLMPFDGTWFYGDALFIIDPWVWLLLGGGVVATRRYHVRNAARTTLVIALAYMITMIATAAGGRRYVESRMRASGTEPTAVMVGPVAVDPNRRQVIVHDGERYLRGEMRLVPRELILSDSLSARLDYPAIRAATSHPKVARFLTWARFPFAIVDSTDSGYLVRFDDVRYSNRSIGSFATVEVFVSRQEIETLPAADP